MMADQTSWGKVRSAMTVKHVHPESPESSGRMLSELNLRCLQRLRAMRAENRDAAALPTFHTEKGKPS